MTSTFEPATRLAEQPFFIESLTKAYSEGLDPHDVIDEVFRRLESANDPGIFISVREKTEVARDVWQLGAFDPGRPLWGIPFAVKDNIDVAGLETTAGCPEFAYSPEVDATCIELLRDAGAIVIGKTNLDQFATGLVGVRTPYPVPRNAINEGLVPGGSSSGSAVAVARGIVSFALGTDTAGSGRVPAALNNIVGVKPSLGLVSNRGVVPACKTLDSVSIFALDVGDGEKVLKIIAQHDSRDSGSRRMQLAPATRPPTFSVAAPDKDSLEFFGDSVQADSFRQSLDEIARLGGEICEISFQPFFEVARLLYDGPWIAERYAVTEKIIQSKPESVLPVTAQVISRATEFSSADVFRGIYRLRELAKQIEPVLEKHAFICVPTIPTFVTLDEVRNEPIAANSKLGIYTNFVNLLDLCAIAFPVAPRRDGLPGSVTILGRAGDDAKVASLAAEICVRLATTPGSTKWESIERSLPPPAIRGDEIALVAVGAHMSGLPLNHELTGLGGRFICATHTAPMYRLYALAGGPPMRPGMVRTDKGASIAVETWALPKDRFGEFISGIPAPLTIGAVVLEDGSEMKGFLCETAGLRDAQDISEFGGWRQFLAHQTGAGDP